MATAHLGVLGGVSAAAARDAAKRSLSIAPDNAQAHQMLGIAEQHLGRHREAGDSYVRAGKLDPTSSSSGELLDGLGAGLGKVVAPAGLGAFMLFRVATRTSARGAESAGIPPGVILVFVIVAMVLFFAFKNTDRPARYDDGLDQLSPEARAIIQQRKDHA